MPETVAARGGIDQRPWVLMFSGSAWAAAAHRQHALARQLAQRSYRVVFVDPPANRVRWRWQVTSVGPSLWNVQAPSALPFGRQLPPVNHLGRWLTGRLLRRWLDQQGGGRRLLWIDEDLAAPVIGQLAEAAVLYDVTDLDWTFTRTWNRAHLKRALARAVAAADLVTVSSSALVARLPATRRPVVVVANACDPDLFDPEGPVASWLDTITRPVIGYLGAIDERALDAGLVHAISQQHPEWSFVLVGPATAAGRAALDGLTNVHLFEAVDFDEVPAILRAFDVALIPYRVGGLIDYVHPKKLYEYLAAGLPVVATPLPALVTLRSAMSSSDGLRVASDADDFTIAIAAALDDNRDPQAAARRRTVAAANSWTARGDQLAGLLTELVAS